MQKNISFFKTKVLSIVSQVPKGQILTYKQVAKLAGSPNAYRAVGNLMRQNHDPNVPCHRIVGSDGKMHGYNRGIINKIALLKKEGVKLNGSTIDLKKLNIDKF